MACECKKEGCKKLVVSGARGGYCKTHTKQKRKTQCRICGKYFFVKPDHHGSCVVNGKVHCYECYERQKEPPEVAERRESPKIKEIAAEANLRIFEEELKARIGYEVLEPFECCNTCQSRVADKCNKWYPNTFKHGAFEAKCRYYTKDGS